jgi:hypothetical protein
MGRISKRLENKKETVCIMAGVCQPGFIWGFPVWCPRRDCTKQAQKQPQNGPKAGLNLIRVFPKTVRGKIMLSLCCFDVS